MDEKNKRYAIRICHYSRIWTEKIHSAELQDKDRRVLEEFLLKALKADKLQLPVAEDNYYYEQAVFLEE